MTSPDAILLTSSFLPGQGGIESYLAALCERLSPRLAVVAPAERAGIPLPRDLGYATHSLSSRRGREVSDTVIKLARSYGTDRVLFGTPWPLVLQAPDLAGAGLRYAVIVHGAELVVPGAVPVLGARLARSLAGADALFPVSNYTAARIRALLSRHRLPIPPIAVARAGIDLERFHPHIATAATRSRYDLPPDRAIVLCLGRLVPRKGVDRVIRALPRIRERIPDVTLVIAGAGPRESALRRAAGGLENVRFLGAVPDEDVPSLYALADVYVLAVADRWGGLEAEGLGIVLVEAAACATPSVTGRSGGTPEAVLDRETGFVVDARRPEELEHAIVALLEDPTEAERMGAMARLHAETSFSGEPPEELLDWLGGKLGR